MGMDGRLRFNSFNQHVIGTCGRMADPDITLEDAETTISDTQEFIFGTAVFELGHRHLMVSAMCRLSTAGAEINSRLMFGQCSLSHHLESLWVYAFRVSGANGTLVDVKDRLRHDIREEKAA